MPFAWRGSCVAAGKMGKILRLGDTQSHRAVESIIHSTVVRESSVLPPPRTPRSKPHWRRVQCFSDLYCATALLCFALLVAPDLSTTSHCNHWNLEHSLALHLHREASPASRVVRRARFNAPCDASRAEQGFSWSGTDQIHQTGIAFLAHVSGLQILCRANCECDEGCCNAISFVGCV